MGKVPLPVLKKLEHQARQNLSTINFTAAFAKTSSCNTTMEKCQHSLKLTFKKVKTQIQKGGNPEKAARRGCDTACDYFAESAPLIHSGYKALQNKLWLLGSSLFCQRTQ